MNILVIGDSRFSRRRIAEAIISAGHTVTEASNGQEGLDLIESVSFDCVVADSLMPVMEG
ncbi:MAG: response regulator, partial [Planctomycetes bacterium]|nr:response regulator [Planctomycetota bacterium]